MALNRLLTCEWTFSYCGRWSREDAVDEALRYKDWSEDDLRSMGGTPETVALGRREYECLALFSPLKGFRSEIGSSMLGSGLVNDLRRGGALRGGSSWSSANRDDDGFRVWLRHRR